MNSLEERIVLLEAKVESLIDELNRLELIDSEKLDIDTKAHVLRLKSEIEDAKLDLELPNFGIFGGTMAEA